MGGASRVLVDPVDPTHNRRHIARSLGMLFLIEGTLGQVWLLLPHEAGQPLPLVAICVLAQVLGVWMRRGGLDFAPLWVLKAMIALGTMLAAAAASSLARRRRALPSSSCGSPRTPFTSACARPRSRPCSRSSGLIWLAGRARRRAPR